MAHVGDGPSGTPPTADGLRLLVVDDNRDAADTLALLLGYWGHQPAVAYDAAAAVRAAVAEPPDAVLLDLGLPGCDGFEVAERLRQTDGLGDVPLVALTGYADQDHRQRAAECGFDLYLVKPVGELALQAVLAQLAEVKRMAKRSLALSAERRALVKETRSLAAESQRRVDALRQTLGDGVWAPRSGAGATSDEAGG
jgi:CheY-like chemotaxis protein